MSVELTEANRLYTEIEKLRAECERLAFENGNYKEHIGLLQAECERCYSLLDDCGVPQNYRKKG